VPGSLPERWIRLRLHDSKTTPVWLTSEDHGWLRVFLDELRCLEGRTLDEFRSVFDKVIMRACLACGGNPRALRGLAALVPSAWTPGVLSAARPSEIRQILFETAATGVSRREAIERTASVLQIEPSMVIPGAFADRTGVRVLTAPDWPVTPASIARHYNLALARALLLKTTELVVRVDEASQSLVQAAKDQRLICSWSADKQGARLVVSGPAALFHHTSRYGHALLRFFPAVMESGRWNIDAQCALSELSARVSMTHQDPIGALASSRPKPRTTPERAVLRAFKGMPGGWMAVRETEALRAGEDIFFPDVRLVRGNDVVRLEWTGFYTPPFLEDRIGRMRKAGLSRYLLCVDETLGVGTLRDDPVLMRYRKTLEIPVLIERIERMVKGASAAA